MTSISQAVAEPQRGERARTVPTGSVFSRAVSSEWTKLRSVRSTVFSLIATVGLTVGLGWLFCFLFIHRDLNERRGFDVFDPTDRALRGVFLAQLAIGVLGALVMSSEHVTGMIRTSLAAVPQRRALLAAKALVLGVVALVVGMSSSFLAFLGGQAILSSPHNASSAVFHGVSLSDPGVLRAVLGAGAYLTCIALLGLAIGTIVRRTPGAISVLFGVVLVAPLLTEGLPSPWNVRVGRWLPLNAGQAMFTVRVDPDLLTPRNGFIVMLVWLAGTFAIATALLSRRDV
jgi:ABC-2 type transport system permease protein